MGEVAFDWTKKSLGVPDSIPQTCFFCECDMRELGWEVMQNGMVYCKKCQNRFYPWEI